MTFRSRFCLRTILFGSTLIAGLVLVGAAIPARAQPPLSLSVTIGPPEIPVYDQPPIPEPGYIWTPGFWQWSPDAGYFWVPGTWVLPPEAGLLWTPPYWGWSDGVYLFHDGYWGQSVGYYGGINYGYGYGGNGYQGGRWHDGDFVYNRTVNNFGSVPVRNSYEAAVKVRNHSHLSYVGGVGGLRSTPTAGERSAEQEQHRPATSEQSRHSVAAGQTPALAASHNNGRPAIAATARPAQFEGADIKPARPAAAVQHAAPARALPVEHPATRPEPAAEPRAEARPQPQPEARPQPQPAARPQPQPEARPQPQPQAHPEPRAEARPNAEREHEKKPEL